MDFGLIVDLETTGIDPATDKIIEIGLVEFAVEDGREPVITGMYGAVEDPGIPLSDDIKRITGLDDCFLQGRRICWQTVREYFDRASVAIAHNAAFDSAFLKRRSELFPLDIHWCCSMRHIDWEGKRYKTRALNYLAADHGFVNSFAHRALFDCATTFRLVVPYLEEMIQRSFLREYRVFATGAPFEAKDKLRTRGYRWDPDRRVWSKVVFEDALPSERGFLDAEVYAGRGQHHEEEIGSTEGPRSPTAP